MDFPNLFFDTLCKEKNQANNLYIHHSRFLIASKLILKIYQLVLK